MTRFFLWMEFWEWDHLGELRDNEYWIVISSGFANRSGGRRQKHQCKEYRYIFVEKGKGEE